MGVSQLEYARISLEAGAALNTYYATGAHLSVTSGAQLGNASRPLPRSAPGCTPVTCGTFAAWSGEQHLHPCN